MLLRGLMKRQGRLKRAGELHSHRKRLPGAGNRDGRKTWRPTYNRAGDSKREGAWQTPSTTSTS